MKILITGGAGFIGSHAAEFYAQNNENEVVVFDNLSRARLMNKDAKNAMFNWDFLKQFNNVELIKGDTRKFDEVKKAAKDCDTIMHFAGQTAVTSSVTDPRTDFETNAFGAFNVLEAARLNGIKNVIYSSTNKVFGHNVNELGIVEEEKRYGFEDSFVNGIPTDFSIDLCEHTPYGSSKLAADIYMQDYHYLYGLKTGVFRMSCIYGTRQFGFEDQGWVAWFTIATLKQLPITIFGDGKQVRDALYVADLIELYDKFIKSKIKHGVYSTGGGKDNTISLLELLDILERLAGKRSNISFDEWRPSDQKVFIADISKAKKELGWTPKINPQQGISRLVDWVKENKDIF